MGDLSRRAGEYGGLPAIQGQAGPATASAGSPEQRVAPRFTLLLRSAKLVGPHGEFLCVLRDASETGVNLRLFHPLPQGGAMMLEMQNGDCHPVELVWQEDGRAGMRFVEGADIARILESPSRFSKRPVRVNIAFEAQLASGADTFPVQVVDLSQQGAKVTSEQHWAIDQRVRLSARGLPEVNAKVRWRRGSTYGLVFEDTFQLGDLARIIATMQQAG